jgi:hypothetical protein
MPDVVDRLGQYRTADRAPGPQMGEAGAPDPNRIDPAVTMPAGFAR